MSYFSQELGGYGTDDACVFCLTPTSKLSPRGACRACSGIEPEKLVYRAAASQTRRMALMLARRKLSAYSTLAVQAIGRVRSLTLRLEDAAAERAQQSAYDDAREAAKAAFVIYPHLAPMRSQVAA